MVMRLDVGLRIYDGATLTVDIGAGPVACPLTAGLYLSLAELCAQLQTDLQAAFGVPQFFVTESAGYVTILRSANFDVTWNLLSLRDHLGFTADLTGTDTYTSDVCSAGVFVPTLPWGDDAMGWRWAIKRADGPRDRGGMLSLGRSTVWRVRALVRASELSQWRRVMRLLLHGVPGTWFRDALNANPWDWSEWRGYVRVALAPEEREHADGWSRPDRLTVMSVPLTLVVWE